MKLTYLLLAVTLVGLVCNLKVDQGDYTKQLLEDRKSQCDKRKVKDNKLTEEEVDYYRL